MSKQFVIGSAEWLELQRSGAFDNRPPVSTEPRRPRRIRYRRNNRGPRGPRSLDGYYGSPCAYCAQPMILFRFATRDHMHPRCEGGTLHANNVAIVCSPCNNEKGGFTLEQFAVYLSLKSDPRAAIVQRLLPQDR